MKLKNIIKGNWWLIFGSLMFLGTTISSIFRSLDGSGFGNTLYMSIDWFAACIIYFFLGAIFGHIVDYFVDRKTKHPLWAYLTAALWITSTIAVFIFAKTEYISIVGKALFPLAYGLFFVGFAFTLLFPNFIVQSFYGKLFFDIIFLGIFSFWIYFTMQNKKQLAARILLIIMFLIFFIGFFGCARALS